MNDQALDFRTSLEQARQQVHQQVIDIFQEYRQRALEIDQWSDWVVQKVETYCLRRGKAVRPWLVAVGAAASQNITVAEALQQVKVQRLMALVELTHYRLILADDVADRDEQRHGFPSFHREMQQWLQEQPQYQGASPKVIEHVARSYTEIAGILLQQIAQWQLHRAPQAFSAEEQRAINDVFDQHEYLATVAGWFRLFDQSFHDLPEVSEAEFLRGLLLVTGHYTFIGPLRLGSICGGKSSELASSIQEYGEAAGVLFQITDDGIGLFGDPQVTGKPVGNDIREGKKSLPFQEAYRQANEKQRHQLTAVLRKESLTDAEVAHTQALIRELGGEQYSQQRVGELVTQGKAALQKWSHQETQQLLTFVLRYLADRQA